MRKFAAILLWGMLLFNWVGYRALHGFLRDRADRQLEAKLDRNQYERNLLIHIKVPAARLSYYTISASFERVTGQIDIDGVPYQYVARRIFNDSAEFLCIPNQVAQSLRSGRDAFFSLVNDLRQPDKGSKGTQEGTSQEFMGDPYMLPASYSFGNPVFARVFHSFYYILQIPEGMHSADERPPAALA